MTAPVSAAAVAANLAAVRGRIAAAGGSDEVTIVAVTKQLPPEAARAAVAAGCSDLGENYADQLISKAELLSPLAVRWHLIGGIQRRSLSRLAPHVALYQSVDRIEEGASIARHAPAASVLVEVDTTGLPGRGGVPPAETPQLVDQLGLLGLSVKGLMTIAAPGDDDAARRTFAAVRRLVDQLGLEVASMGMSDDFPLAVAEGSTMVRIGRALFGPRPLG